MTIFLIIALVSQYYSNDHQPIIARIISKAYINLVI